MPLPHDIYCVVCENYFAVPHACRKGEEPLPSRRTRIYVAGPYTTGDTVANCRRALEVGSDLLERGYTPYIPHLTLLWDIVNPHLYATWLAHDREWVGACDAVLRLSGESLGADRECEDARGFGIPVYYSLETLYAGFYSRILRTAARR